MYFETELFVRAVRNQNQGYISGLCIPWSIFEQIGIDMLYLHIFLNYNTATEVYLEPIQTYMIRIFCENSYSFCLLTGIQVPS